MIGRNCTLSFRLTQSLQRMEAAYGELGFRKPAKVLVFGSNALEAKVKSNI